MQVYIDTAERSHRMNGGGATETTYVVRLAATKSRPGRILATFETLERAQEYASLATDRRWALVQTA